MPPERCASPPSPPFHAIDVPQRTSPAPHHRSPAPSAPPAVSSSAPPVGTHDTKVFACTIGRKPSKAKYYLDDPADIVRLIQASSSMESPTMTASSAFEPSPEMERFLCERLLDAAQPIAERFRALFSLRNLRGDAPRCALLQAARDSSNLLAHEAAFALGQMQDAEAIPALEAVLKDLSLHPIVRHEAAEAPGAIGLAKSIPLLEESLAADPAVEVRETCELALKRIEEQKNVTGAESTTISPFLSVDPALPAKQGLSVEQLRELLLNEQESMYECYAALFALRNDGGDAAVSAIVAALGVKSALLRHEVAYVLGQLQNKAASDALSAVLKNVDEHPMVRHEAAEALGSIADQESIALLEEFAKDAEPILSQSCEVALSMLEYERSGKSFEFLFLQTPQVQQES